MFLSVALFVILCYNYFGDIIIIDDHHTNESVQNEKIIKSGETLWVKSIVQNVVYK